MSLPPVEIPLGAMRFNSDSQKLEYFNGQIWMQIHTFTPDLANNQPGPGPRGVNGCGLTSPGGIDDVMDYVNISSQGNAVNFGNATANHEHKKGTASSRTRGVWAGGNNPSQVDSIDYVTISSTGDASDFGNLTSVRNTIAGCGNGLRGIFCNGHDSNSGSPYNSNIINYINIATTGNAVDFGDTVNQARDRGGVSVPTLGFVYGGTTSSGNTNTIEKITINTTGNAVDSGFDATLGGSGGNSASNAGSGRCIFQGSGSSPYPIEQFNAYSMSNSYDFGDISANGQSEGGSPCSPVRALFTLSSSYANTIEYMTIATLGNAVDFGDLTAGRTAMGSLSNAHGGL
tara:strand:- start:17 stop:1048 length:1032 start_codon:yes stop_codon:yes gene_type:complete